jgi:ABC-type transporter Mla subunit MlaD
VTLAGIRIGEVERLEPVRDQRGAIRVRLKINDRYPLPANVSLTIGSSGIFGDSYLAFSANGQPSTATLAMDGSAEVVAGRGFFETASQKAEQILNSTNELLGPDMRAEYKRLVSNAADLAAAGTTLAKHIDEQNQRLADTLTAVQKLADELRTQTAPLATKVGSATEAVTNLAASIQKQSETLTPRIASTLDKLDGVATRGQAALATGSDDLHAALTAITTLTGRIDHIAANVETGQGVMGRLLMDQQLAHDLDNTAVDLSRTAALIADHPEALVFGTGQDGDEQARRRAEEKQRRALLPPLPSVRLEEAKPAK